MIIDCHTHIFPDEIRNHRHRFFKGEPGFELLYHDPESARLAGVEEILESMDEQGVDRSVIFGFPWYQPETTRLHNDYILDAVRRFPERLSGLCCLDPFMTDPVSEIERCIDGGLAGVGELAFYDRGLDDDVLNALEPVMAFCKANQLPVMLHTNEPIGHFYPGKAPMTLKQIVTLLERYRENILLLAHWGGGVFLYHVLKREIKNLLKDVYFDTAASPFLYDSAVYDLAAATIGCEHILFGSDFPLLKPERYFREMDATGLDNEQLAAVKGMNTARILGLEDQCVSF